MKMPFQIVAGIIAWIEMQGLLIFMQGKRQCRICIRPR
jgi:hypothetical protein